MDKELHTTLTKMGEDMESLEGLVRTFRKDVMEDLERIKNNMVTKKYLDQGLEALEANVATKESIQHIMRSDNPQGVNDNG